MYYFRFINNLVQLWYYRIKRETVFYKDPRLDQTIIARARVPKELGTSSFWRY